MDLTRFSSLPLRFLATATSTNDEARDWARQGAPDGACVLAEGQTAGRGRLGRTWIAPPGLALTLSQIIRPLAGVDIRRIPLLGAWAARRCAVDTLGEGAAGIGIKWPNDLLVGERKLAGILAEWHPDPAPFAVLGIGLNVNQMPADFPPDLRLPATSLRMEAERRLDRATVLERLLFHLADGRGLLRIGPLRLVDEVRKHCATLGQRIRIHAPDGQQWEGVARALADDGALEVESDQGRLVRLEAADVQHLTSMEQAPEP